MGILEYRGMEARRGEERRFQYDNCCANDGLKNRLGCFFSTFHLLLNLLGTFSTEVIAV